MIDRRKRNILITIIVLLGIAFDQISKVWVRNNFESYIETSIVGDIFTLIKVENTGAFLGMGSELPETLRVLLLIVLPVIVLVGITVYTYLDKSLDKTSIIEVVTIILGINPQTIYWLKHLLTLISITTQTQRQSLLALKIEDQF